MARKDGNKDVKVKKKMVKNEAEEFSEDEVCDPWPSLGQIGAFGMWLLSIAILYPSS